MELGLIVEMAVTEDPDRVAVTDVDGAALTRSELQRRAQGAAASFLRAGARQVGFLAPNGRTLPITLFGAALAGRPFVPLNYRWADEQLSDVLSREPGLIVVASPEAENRLANLGWRATIPERHLLDDTAMAPDLLLVDPDEIAVLLYTSGTTGAPKAAVLRHRHLTSYVVSTMEFGSAGPEDAALVSVPPYHVAGVASILSNLYAGRRIVYLDTFDEHRWLELVRREQATHAMVVPTMLARIVDAMDHAEADVSSLRSVAYGGAKIPERVITKALERFPHVRFTNAYGLTETSSTIAMLGPKDHRAALASEDPAVRARLRSAGRPVPGVEVAIVDETGEPCPPGVVGDIVVRGPQVSGEYVDADPGEPGSWFVTRDRGWLDEQGYLFVEGRADDTIIRGGENIAPAEIEEVLLRHDHVADCAVVGVSDEEWGQRIAAAVVLVPDGRADADELREWVRRHLRTSKTPDVIELWSSLPYNPMGKLLRREVQASLTGTKAGAGPDE